MGDQLPTKCALRSLRVVVVVAVFETWSNLSTILCPLSKSYRVDSTKLKRTNSEVISSSLWEGDRMI